MLHLHSHLKHNITHILSAILRIRCATMIWMNPLKCFNKCDRDKDSSGMLIDAEPFISEYIVGWVDNSILLNANVGANRSTG